MGVCLFRYSALLLQILFRPIYTNPKYYFALRQVFFRNGR